MGKYTDKPIHPKAPKFNVPKSNVSGKYSENPIHSKAPKFNVLNSNVLVKGNNMNGLGFGGLA